MLSIIERCIYGLTFPCALLNIITNSAYTNLGIQYDFRRVSCTFTHWKRQMGRTYICDCCIFRGGTQHLYYRIFLSMFFQVRFGFRFIPGAPNAILIDKLQQLCDFIMSQTIDLVIDLSFLA